MLKRILTSARFVYILAALSLLPAICQAFAYDTYIDRRNGSNSQTVPITIPVPVSDGIYYYDKANFMPKLVLVGSSLQISGGYINCVQPTLLSQLTNDVGFLTSLPYHNHDAADITTGVFSDFRIPALDISKINGLQDALDAKADTGSNVAWSTVTGFTGVTSVNSNTGAVTLTYSDVGAEASGASAAAQAYSVQRSNHTGTQTLATISDAGTAAALNVATSGDASSLQVVKGNDSRLSDSRVPTAHTHTASQVTDFNSAADSRVAAGIASAIMRTRVQTNTSGTYTWTFPTAFGSGITPIVSITVEDSSSATWNHQITSISNTSVTVQLSKSTAVTILGISVLGVAATPQAYVHLTAIAP